MTETVKLLGLGLAPRDHATVETLQALAACDDVRAQGFSKPDLAFLAKQCRKGALKAVPASADPKALAAGIVAAALKGRRAALATPIHPFYHGPAGAAVVAACAEKKVPWTSFGSVSPMGAAISVAGVTLGTNVFGLQSFEAEALAEHEVEPNPVWPLILYFLRPLPASAAPGLAKALSALYASSHPALWCAGALAGKSVTLEKALVQAGKAAAGDTLFLGPSRRTKSTLGRTDRHRVSIKGAVAPPLVEE